MKQIFTLILFTTFILNQSSSLNAQVNTTDSLALVDLYNSTDGANWTTNTNWLSTKPVSKWYHVQVENNRVIFLYVHKNNLQGTLPASLGNLTALQDLDLSANKLTGSIPSSIGNLVSLTNLNLLHNKLTGSIPVEMGNLPKLLYLTFSHNSLSGNIPASFSNLSTLIDIDLSQNNLEGNFNSLLHLSNISTLNLEYNKLSGSISGDISNLINLTFLILDHNQFTGEIPARLGNITGLKFLDLSFNNLSGTMPSALGNLINIESYFLLNNNQLTGKIPTSLGKITKVKTMDLSNNQLSGTIPSSLDSLTSLVQLHIEKNKFTFGGMKNIIKTFPFTTITPQANIDVHKNGGTLSVDAGGENALKYNTYHWYNGSNAVANITGDSTYQPNQSGSYSVIVTNSKVSTLTLYSNTINYSLTNNAIASQIKTNNAIISLYPNPAKSITTLLFNADGKYTITVTDVSGKILQTKTGVANTSTNNIQLDVSKYASGIYLVTIIDEKNKKQTFRLNKE